MKKLSIITINLNNKAGLEKTIQSVISQTFTDYEFILIDGGSSDGSLTLLEHYATFFHYWVSEKDGGIYQAQNKGIRQAKGEYCLFLNSGDYLYQNKSLEEFFSHDFTAELVYGKVFLLGYDCIREHPEQIRLSYLLKDSINHQVQFIKRSLLETLGMYAENYRMISDYLLLIDVVKHSISHQYIPVVVTAYDTVGFSIQNLPLFYVEKEQGLKEHLPAFVYDFCKDYLQVLEQLEKSKQQYQDLERHLASVQNGQRGLKEPLQILLKAIKNKFL